MNKDELDNEVFEKIMEVLCLIEENIRDDNMSETVRHIVRAVLQAVKDCDNQNKIKRNTINETNN